MELINNIKRRFHDWTYNLWFKIGKKYKWHTRRMMLQSKARKQAQKYNKQNKQRKIKKYNGQKRKT